MTEPLALGAPMSVNYDHVTKDVVLTWRVMSTEHNGMDDVAVCRIAPRDLTDFLGTITREAMYSLRDVATAIAWGDCDTCGNQRLVKAPGIVEGTTTTVRCPDCSTEEHQPDGPPVPFADWPRYRKPADRPQWCNNCQAWVTVDENNHHTVVHSDPNWEPA